MAVLSFFYKLLNVLWFSRFPEIPNHTFHLCANRNGGLICGLTRDLRRGSSTCAWTTASQNTTSGPSLCRRTTPVLWTWTLWTAAIPSRLDAALSFTADLDVSPGSAHHICCVLQVNVGHPSEVDEIFDAISYSKGASVIRMLHNYIGDEVGGRPFLIFVWFFFILF